MHIERMNHRQSLPLFQSLLHEPGSVDHDPEQQPYVGITFHRTSYFVQARVWSQIKDSKDQLRDSQNWQKFEPRSKLPDSISHLLQSFCVHDGWNPPEVGAVKPSEFVHRLLARVGASPLVDLRYRDVKWTRTTINDLPTLGFASDVEMVWMSVDRRQHKADWPEFVFIRYLKYVYDAGGFCEKQQFYEPGYSVPDPYDPEKLWVWDVIEYNSDNQRRYYTATHMNPTALGCLVNLRTPKKTYSPGESDVKTLIAQTIEPSRKKHFAKPTFEDILEGSKAIKEKYARAKFTTEEINLMTMEPRWTEEQILNRRNDYGYQPAWMVEDEKRYNAEIERIAREGRAEQDQQAAAAERRRRAEERAKNTPDDEWPSTEIE